MEQRRKAFERRRSGKLIGAGARPRRALSEMEPPADILAERAVVGSVLRSAECLDEAAEILPPEDFYDVRLRSVYRAMLRLREQDERIDEQLINAELRAMKAAGEDIGFEDLGETGDYLPELLAALSVAPDSLHVRSYAQQVVWKAQLRRFAEVSMDLLSEACAPGRQAAPEFFAKAERAIWQIADRAPNLDERPFAELLAVAREMLFEGRKPDIHTGFEELDLMLLPQPGDLVVLAAETSKGKTTLASNMMVNAACATSAELVAERRRGLLYVTLEMRREQIAQRLLCAAAGVASVGARAVADDYRRRVAEAEESLAKLNIDVMFLPRVTAERLRAVAARARRRLGPLAMVVVDYLQLMGAPSGFEWETREAQIAENSHALKSLADELGCVVLCLSQFNREISHRDKPIPRLSDLRGSGAIEQDADQIVFLYQDPQKEQGLMTLKVEKNRNGPTGSCHVRHTPALMRFDPVVSEFVRGQQIWRQQ